MASITLNSAGPFCGGPSADLRIQLDEWEAGKDAPSPSDRTAADASSHLLHLDLRHDARDPLGPRPQSLAKRPRLGLGHDEFHQRRGVEVQQFSVEPRSGLRPRRQSDWTGAMFSR
jgi:hypothetical protein